MNNRRAILDDRDFWDRLEFVASGMMANSPNRALRRFWNDGVIPESATNTRRGLDVEGIVWVGVGGAREQQSFRFVASIPQNMLQKHARDFEIESLTLDCDRTFLRLIISRQVDHNTAAVGS